MRENCARTCGFCVVGEENEINNGNERLPENNGKPVVVERLLFCFKNFEKTII